MNPLRSLPVLICLGLLPASCRTPPETLRESFPLTPAGETNFFSPNAGTFFRDGVSIRIEYLDRERLFELTRLNRPGKDCDGTDPVMTVFLAAISNTTELTLRGDPLQAVLHDGTGRTLKALDREAFREKWPATHEMSCAYGFLFEASAVLEAPERRFLKRSVPVRLPLHRGGVLPSGTARSFLVFDRTSLLSRGFTLAWSGFSLTNKTTSSVIPFDAEFTFIQRLRRRKEDR